jgi:hypothetical protein
MRRYDIIIDRPRGTKFDVETLREILPEWIDVGDECEAEDVIANGLAVFVEYIGRELPPCVTVYPSRVHVREREQSNGPKIMVRRRSDGRQVGPWMHFDDGDVPECVSVGIYAEWRWIGHQGGRWAERPWSEDLWDWYCGEPCCLSGDPKPRISIWRIVDPAGSEVFAVMLVDQENGGEMTAFSYHTSYEDACVKAQRESALLRLSFEGHETT